MTNVQFISYDVSCVITFVNRALSQLVYIGMYDGESYVEDDEYKRNQV